MAEQTVILQLSDTHVGADWAGDSTRALAVTVASARRLLGRPDAVLISGDLAENGDDGEYELLQQLVAPLEAPVYVLPGNHDDRERLRRCFDLGGPAGKPIVYGVDVGPLRLAIVDSKRAGSDAGELDRRCLSRLDAELAVAPDSPTIVALHHPPVSTGNRGWDAIGLPAADRRRLGDLLRRHPQVLLIVGGHLHQSIAAHLDGRPVLVAPSTYVQARAAVGSDRISFTDEPPGFAVHVFADGAVTSYRQAVDDPETARV